MEEKSILWGAYFFNEALFLKKEKILVLADLHLGIESALKESHGLLLPKQNFSRMIEKLRKIFKKAGKVNKVILLGDVKDGFKGVSEQEWGEAIDLIDFLKQHSREVILIKGNHDILLERVAGWKETELRENLFLEKEKILFFHGHKAPEKKLFEKAKVLVIGHEHPAITLKEGVKREKVKCFLKGKFKGKTLIVLPPFSPVSEGRNILAEEPMSEFLKQDLSEFEAWLVEDRVYYFGRIKNLM